MYFRYGNTEMLFYAVIGLWLLFLFQKFPVCPTTGDPLDVIQEKEQNKTVKKKRLLVSLDFLRLLLKYNFISRFMKLLYELSVPQDL